MGVAVGQDRYELLHLVSRTRVPGLPDVELWRATDAMLARTVALTMFTADDPRAAEVRTAVQALAGLDARPLVRLLDVVEDTQRLIVVTEWVDGSTLADVYEERSGEPLGARRALQIAQRVAEALAVAHEAGVQHGHLRPASVLLTATGDVRLRGVALDAAVWGQVADPVATDIDGVGSLLYAGLTARWPGGLVGGLPAATRGVSGEVLLPSQVSAEVPAHLDRVIARSVRACALRGAPPFTSAAEMATALGVATSRLRTPTVTADRRVRRVPGRRVAVRVGTLAGILGIAAVIGVVGVGVLNAAPSPWGSTAAPEQAAVFSATSEADAAQGSGSPELKPVRLRVLGPDGFVSDPAAGIADPLGGKPRDAVDGSPLTGWLTPTYGSADLDGASGIGLVLDLGAAQAVSAVDLGFVGAPTSVDVRLAPQPWTDPGRWTPFASVAGVGQTITVRAPRPVIGRYVLIWLTGVPRADDGYRGGVLEVRVT
jgi:putative peptidoglycan lipid II flippase